MFKISKSIKSIIIILGVAVIFLPAAPVFAHLMLIEPVEEGKVRVIFDDGSAARHAEVVVFDENEKELARGDVDRDGYFSFAPEKAELLVAEDGFGHRAEFVTGEEVRQFLPRGPVVAVVLLGFALVSGFFQYRVQKNRAPVRKIKT